MNSLEKNFSVKCILGHTVHVTMWAKSQVQSTGSFCLFFLHLHNSVTNGKKLEKKNLADRGEKEALYICDVYFIVNWYQSHLSTKMVFVAVSVP